MTINIFSNETVRNIFRLKGLISLICCQMRPSISSLLLRRKTNRFFLYLAYNAPHSPLHGKTEDLKHLYPEHQPTAPQNGIDYRDYEGRQNYIAMMYAVDRGIAQIEAALKDPNADGKESDSILNDTLIVFPKRQWRKSFASS